MALLDDILQAARIGETTDWEFKSVRGGFPGSFWETYSGMANSEGGVVVLGVREDAVGAHLDGLNREQITRYQKALWDVPIGGCTRVTTCATMLRFGACWRMRIRWRPTTESCAGSVLTIWIGPA